MDYIKIVEKLKRSFLENPIDFVTEFDLQIKLIELIRKELGKQNKKYSEIKKTKLIPQRKFLSYKYDYFERIEKTLEKKNINRVHAEVSIKKGRRIDVVVFKPKINNSIQWIRRGSKRFDSNDIEAAFELKFIKNKYNVPTIKNSDKINMKENKLESDIEDLGELTNSKNFLIIFSNNNYLYHNYTKKEEKYKEYILRGKKARNEIKNRCKKNQINVLYVHPLGFDWINKCE